MSKNDIIAIDGPAGVGKSTTSKRVAQELSGVLLNTGSMYRSVAYFALEKGLIKKDEILSLTKSLKFELDLKSGNILVNGLVLDSKIRQENIGKEASRISAYPSIRAILTTRQRELGLWASEFMPVVAEGRDMGSVVFPEAIKIFLIADINVRAKRRYNELIELGETPDSIETIIKKLKERDKRDSTRSVAPLLCAKDAYVIDTSNLSIDEVVAKIIAHVKKTKT